MPQTELAANKTALHTALDTILDMQGGRSLAEIVTEQRSAGTGWDRIAADINKATGVPVHGSTLVNWFPEVKS